MEVLNDFSRVDILMIMQLWEKKPIEYIANMLDRPYHTVERKVQELSKVHKVTLYQRPTFTGQLKSKEKELEWAKKQLRKDDIVIRKIDTSSLIAVKVNAKTVIYVKPGTDIDEIKKKYSRPTY